MPKIRLNQTSKMEEKICKCWSRMLNMKKTKSMIHYKNVKIKLKTNLQSWNKLNNQGKAWNSMMELIILPDNNKKFYMQEL